MRKILFILFVCLPILVSSQAFEPMGIEVGHYFKLRNGTNFYTGTKSVKTESFITVLPDDDSSYTATYDSKGFRGFMQINRVSGGVSDGWGNDVVNTDNSLSGNGTPGNPLRIATTAYSSLSELKNAVSNDFHTLGGTDDDRPESGDLGIIDTEAKFENELFEILTPAELPAETDPVFSASVLANIDASDTTRWGKSKETDPVFTASVLAHVDAADTSRWGRGAGSENDPVFTASAAAGIHASDISRWNAGGSNTYWLQSADSLSATVPVHLNDSLYLNYALSAYGSEQWLGLSATGGVFADSITNAGFALAMPIPGPVQRLCDRKNGEIAWYDTQGKHYSLKNARPTIVIERLMASDEIAARHIANNRLLIYVIIIQMVAILLILMWILKKIHRYELS